MTLEGPVMNCLGRAALAAILIAGAASANAQITTVVAAPPKRNEPARQAAAAQREQAAQDSIARVTMTGMKEWVDSAAAALAIRPDTAPTAADTSVGTPRAATSPAPGSRSQAPTRADSTAEFREGAKAPDTATPIPAIALAGALLIAIGVAMKRRERTAAIRARR
jgi:hypothetical protein